MNEQLTASSGDLTIGIDIGGTNTAYGIVDKDGNILHRGKINTIDYKTVEEFVIALYQEIQPVISSMGGISRFRGIGVGAPNGNYYNGTIEYAPNLVWQGIIPLAHLLSERFACRVVLTNDANAAAMGEMQYGAARGLKDFIMITLGTGVGSGIVSNGKLIYGHDGFAGELGHCVIIPDGRYHPGTGLSGSLEMYASASGVVKTVMEFLENPVYKNSGLHLIDRSTITSKTVYEYAINGDELAQEVYAYTGNILGRALANYAMATSPEAIILFGGLVKAGDYLLVPVRQAFEKNCLPLHRNKIKIITSTLGGADAAILGGSALLWE